MLHEMDTAPKFTMRRCAKVSCLTGVSISCSCRITRPCTHPALKQEFIDTDIPLFARLFAAKRAYDTVYIVGEMIPLLDREAKSSDHAIPPERSILIVEAMLFLSRKSWKEISVLQSKHKEILPKWFTSAYTDKQNNKGIRIYYHTRSRYSTLFNNFTIYSKLNRFGPHAEIFNWKQGP